MLIELLILVLAGLGVIALLFIVGFSMYDEIGE
mgnify:CR=1 FL=1